MKQLGINNRIVFILVQYFIGENGIFNIGKFNRQPGCFMQIGIIHQVKMQVRSRRPPGITAFRDNFPLFYFMAGFDFN